MSDREGLFRAWLFRSLEVKKKVLSEKKCQLPNANANTDATAKFAPLVLSVRKEIALSSC